jgi:spermidine/putrescine transport system ATP-binding protein
MAKDMGTGPGTASITAKNVSKVFGSGANAFTALKEVSLDIRENEFFTLLGPSGCGKTTLLRVIAGFEQPTTGSIFLGGQDISSQPPFKRPVNTVFQNYALFPHMSVAQNISFGLEMLGKAPSEIASTTAEMLALVQMEPMAERKITQISGGQQQRVALARALAPKPKVLLLDEPLSALDLQLRKEMQLELKRLQTETGITFVFVTHDQEEALTMSDRIAVMNSGDILQIGSPNEIYEKPLHKFVASFIGEINLIPAKLNKKGVAGISRTGELKISDTGKAKIGNDVTLAIRPERIALQKLSKSVLPGIVTNVVYHGTDTIFHFDLPNGTAMRARSQNNQPTTHPWKTGDKIGWKVDPASIAVLENSG